MGSRITIDTFAELEEYMLETALNGLTDSKTTFAQMAFDIAQLGMAFGADEAERGDHEQYLVTQGYKGLGIYVPTKAGTMHFVPPIVEVDFKDVQNFVRNTLLRNILDGKPLAVSVKDLTLQVVAWSYTSAIKRNQK